MIRIANSERAMQRWSFRVFSQRRWKLFRYTKIERENSPSSWRVTSFPNFTPRGAMGTWVEGRRKKPYTYIEIARHTLIRQNFRNSVQLAYVRVKCIVHADEWKITQIQIQLFALHHELLIRARFSFQIPNLIPANNESWE